MSDRDFTEYEEETSSNGCGWKWAFTRDGRELSALCSRIVGHGGDHYDAALRARVPRASAPPVTREEELPCYCAETSMRNCPRHCQPPVTEAPRTQTDREILEEFFIIAHGVADDDPGSINELNADEQRCMAEALRRFRIASRSGGAEPNEDTKRLDWLEGELERERTHDTMDASLFRRNMPITRAAIDAARRATPTQPEGT